MAPRDTSDIIHLASKILHKQYCEQDIEYVIQSFDPQITWFGAGEGQHLEDYDEIAAYFRRYKNALPICNISEEEYHVTQLESDIFLCTGKLWIIPVESTRLFRKIHQRISFLFKRTGKELKCVHIHSSDSSAVQKDGELLPEEMDPAAYKYLETRVNSMEEQLLAKKLEIGKSANIRQKAYEELIQKNRQMQVIINAVKGGLKISLDDEVYSYAYVSDELCSLFGYTKEEFLQVTDSCAVGAVYPPDLPRVLHECEEAFRYGDKEYAIKYRVKCKDGSLKWIIDSGKKAYNELGETIINSIYLDVTDLEEANIVISEQKELLDSIYDSVMCGILRYSILDGNIQFITMNQEARRMLGYESEEQCAAQGVEEFYNRIYIEDRNMVLEKKRSLKKAGDNYSLEYRIESPDGKIIWVYGTTELLQEQNGLLNLQRIMVDITEKKKLELALEEERQRFRIAIESTPVIIFEYDIASDRYSAYGTLEEQDEKHNVELIITDYIKEHAVSHIDEEYLEQFKTLLTGKAGKVMEFRMAPYYGSEERVWAKIIITILTDSSGEPVKIIGKINNIESEKEKDFALLVAKTRDRLTGLYNKETGITMVQDYLDRKSPDEICGLMLLDMDDFKIINKEEGRVFGDVVLQDVADILKAETGKNDIQIRLGGDEFMLFIKGCDKARATVLGPRIVQQIQDIFLKTNKAIKASVSIGMCVTSVAEDYSGLYRCAESTLKYVKENKKGTAACYLDTSNELGVFLTQVYKEEHLINEIDRQGISSEEDMVSFALELLGRAKNMDDAIFLLLGRIGKSCGYDRVSMLETNPEYLYYRFAYQWAKDPSDIQMKQDFYVSREEYEAACHMYDEEGLCDYNISDGVSEYQSCLHAAIWEHGLYIGSLSMEVKHAGYKWSLKERKMLKELVKIIPSFSMKAKADAVSQAKTDFLSRMSHEIRTPMNAIAGMTTIAKTILDDKSKAMDCLTKIESANAYLLELINDILDMSRIESGKIMLNYESLDWEVLNENLKSLLKPQATAKKIDLIFENDYTSNRSIKADALRLNQVLVNIIGNAIKFTDAGGKIIVKTQVEAQDDREVTLRTAVIDTGIGIKEEARERIFNAFEQSDLNTVSKYGGTGLGLSISSRLVQMMGGTLEVKSELGIGSEFYFTLTFAFDEDGNQIPGKSEMLENIEIFLGKKILLAEDNELNREIAKTILEMKSFVVETVENGKEAMELFLKSKPYTYDAILMDIRMPVMDGLEATRRIRMSGKEDSRSIPIIAMTANAFNEDSKRSIESGMDGHLSKPIQVDQLYEMLRLCIQKRNKDNQEVIL